MAPRRSTATQWISVIGSAVCLTAFAVFLVIQFSQGDLDRGDKLASIVSMSVTIVTLPLSVLAILVSLRQGQRDTPAVLNLGERLDAMAEALALSVRTQWETEEQYRRIHDPFPLPARWTTAPEHLMDHWQNINGSPDRADPISLTDHGDHIVDTFNRVPSGRLVVLGPAGAGKTVLTSRFVLTLLASRSTPVPVIFSLGSWDPTAGPLHAWLADQLINTYPILAERDSTGTTIAERLFATGRILPVLDGFDEISAGLRVEAITAINTGLRPGERLLLTSRPGEYAAAVRDGDVLTAAAVVQLEPLTVTDLATYLPLTTRKAHGGQNRWQPVLDHLRATPDAPLAEVLSTPLMVALARAIHSDTDADPAELIGIPSATELEDRLLAGFVPAVYSGARQQTHDAEDARRWLGFLAVHLHRLGTVDLAWWRLVFAVPPLLIGLVSGLGIALGAYLVTGLPLWLGGAPDSLWPAWLWASGGSGLLAGIVGGFALSRRRGVRPSPARLRLTVRGRAGQVLRHVRRALRSWRSLAWIVVWGIGGLLFGSVIVASSGSAVRVLVGVLGGLVIGGGTWFIAVSIRALGAPIDPTEVVSPAELLRVDRATSLREGLCFGVAFSTVLWLTLWVIFSWGMAVPFNAVFGRGVWLVAAVATVGIGMVVWMLFVTVWGPWMIARLWLPLTGRLPWSVMAFLDDAHRRGVLRQAGGVYQFRHARLQDYLAGR